MEYPIITKNDALDTVYNVKENLEEKYVSTIQGIIASRPFGNHKFYIFSFMKRVCDITGVKKLFHYARLTKPEPLPGTTLLRVDPNCPEEAYIVWSLPNDEAFNLYKVGRMFSDPFVHECIMKYLYNREELMKPEPGDLTDEQIRNVYKEKHNIE